MNTSTLVQKLWNDCNVLRDDADANAAPSPKQLIEQFRKRWISFQFPVHRIDNPLEVRVIH
jgi:hypothetical protein